MHVKLHSLLGRTAVFGAVAILGIASPLLEASPRRHAPKPDIIARLENDGRFSVLLTALEVTELTDTVRNGGPFTLFAPTDSAFGTLPPGTVEALVADPATLTQILLYHVIDGRASSFDLIRDSATATLQGDSLLVAWSYDAVSVNQIPVAQANVPAGNGLIHVLEAGVLLPPDEPLPINSVVDVLKLDGRFTILLAAAEAAGLADELATLPALTLFAPTDDAFAALPPGTVDSLLANPEALADILLYHVVGAKKGVFTLFWDRAAETLQGGSVDISIRDGKVFINEATLLNPNLNAPNGYIHVIDQVLLPPVTPVDVVELLAADPRFSTLVAAVQAAGLVDTLKTAGPFTILAPTNDAFAKLPAGTVESLLADPEALANILLYHVIAGEKSLKDLRRSFRVETLQGGKVRVFWWYHSGTLINRARVLESDLAAGNGVVHVIDTVLLPK